MGKDGVLPNRYKIRIAGNPWSLFKHTQAPGTGLALPNFMAAPRPDLSQHQCDGLPPGGPLPPGWDVPQQ